MPRPGVTFDAEDGRQELLIILILLERRTSSPRQDYRCQRGRRVIRHRRALISHAEREISLSKIYMLYAISSTTRQISAKRSRHAKKIQIIAPSSANFAAMLVAVTASLYMRHKCHAR